MAAVFQSQRQDISCCCSKKNAINGAEKIDRKCSCAHIQLPTGTSVRAIFVHAHTVMLEKSPGTLKGLKIGLNNIISYQKNYIWHQQIKCNRKTLFLGCEEIVQR
jgi:hypothetical protein